MRVCVDCGHGYGLTGKPSGACGIVPEDDMVFDAFQSNPGIGNQLKWSLKGHGAEVVTTRSTAKRLSVIQSKDLKARVDIAKKSKSDVFVSVHCNSAADPKANGFEVVVAEGDKKSFDLSTRICKAVESKFGETLRMRGVKMDNQGAHKSLYVLEKLKGVMPAVLIECGFVSNKADAMLLKSLDFRRTLTTTIANVILGR